MPADPNRVNWDACALEKITEMVSRRVFADGEAGAAIVQTELRKGALVPQHTHAGDQLIQVSQGTIVVALSGRRVTLQAGESLTIPAGQPHQIEALDDSVVVDVRFGDAKFIRATTEGESRT